LQAAAARHARVQLEMGGKNPLVILNDADLDTAVDAAINGAYFSTGQRCTASSRLIVEAGIHERFVDAMLARLAALDVDHALKKGVDIGPLADQAQLQTSLDHIAAGRKEGAQLLHGGQRLERATRGFFMQPALFAGTPEMRLAREQIFGPVAIVIRADDHAHALYLANETPRALCAGICTRSLEHARHFRRHSQSALVTVNLPTTGVDDHAPLRKTDFYTTTKTACMAS
jgi:aldehyde dehydrogenase (NAD+)